MNNADDSTEPGCAVGVVLPREKKLNKQTITHDEEDHIYKYQILKPLVTA